MSDGAIKMTAIPSSSSRTAKGRRQQKRLLRAVAATTLAAGTLVVSVGASATPAQAGKSTSSAVVVAYSLTATVVSGQNLSQFCTIGPTAAVTCTPSPPTPYRAPIAQGPFNGSLVIPTDLAYGDTYGFVSCTKKTCTLSAPVGKYSVGPGEGAVTVPPTKGGFAGSTATAQTRPCPGGELKVAWSLRSKGTKTFSSMKFPSSISGEATSSQALVDCTTGRTTLRTVVPGFTEVTTVALKVAGKTTIAARDAYLAAVAPSPSGTPPATRPNPISSPATGKKN